MISAGQMRYGVEVDITSYKDGVRSTLSNSAEYRNKTAKLEQIDSFMKDQGCSVRLLCPQKHSEKMWKLLGGMEDYFGMGAGCNVYWTPSKTQGFAPHYDDIEAFVIQVEGQKRWRVYPPQAEAELPRVSSSDFQESEIGQEVLDVVLQPGDILYFPRGWIHQAEGVGDVPSLHLTVSTAQQQTWYDFLEVFVQHLLQRGFEENVNLRRTLPIGYARFMGLMHSKESDSAAASDKAILRQHFLGQAMNFLGSCLEVSPSTGMRFMDVTADEAACRFLYDRQPPYLTKVEKKRSTPGGRNIVTEQSTFRLIRPDVVRMKESDEGDGSITLYHSVHNSRAYHETGPHGLTFLNTSEDLDCDHAIIMIEHLMQVYPEYVSPGKPWPCWSDAYLEEIKATHGGVVNVQLALAEILLDNKMIILGK